MNYTEKQIKAMFDNLNPVSERQLYDLYDDVLCAVYDSAPIAGRTYSVGAALKAVDAIAYRCGFADWLDGEIRDGLYTDEIQGEHFRQEEVDALLESIEGDGDKG
jgi:hypothetical protein